MCFDIFGEEQGDKGRLPDNEEPSSSKLYAVTFKITNNYHFVHLDPS